MRGTFTQLLVLVFLIGCSVVLGSEKNQTTLFPLTDRAPVIQQIPANSSVTLQTKSAPTSQDAFWIFEVHTRERRVFFAHPNASSSASVKLGRESDFEPTHTGFTVFKSDLATNATFPTINVTNPNNVSLSAIFMVSSYDVSNAVPGGCTHFNQSALNSSTSRPDLKLTWGQNLVQVNFSLSGLLGAPDFTCNNSDLAGIKYSLYVR